ncbi:ABC transporter substrate-binding protein [Deferribacteraceae bacterium V6Fe1]|uniref:ABC transporter substrate-binding protein n=1 Tax=Deferrivibrio essentukiensis TaxID=2880922 RepID=UPI001F602145|nr:ABC transporter substrate-binding protein [Deferrivibrio essentukiensis]MCB4204600.1 ABC transporter substrate-binding protein [Deferrivibrio essentukiensis]UOD33936.1 ABC transporter substrate-binding protein [Deferribacteraceae bacterium V6Fe1]
MTAVIDTNISIKELVEKYPETLDILVANGFEMFKDENKLNSVGKILKLGSALKSKGFDEETFVKLLEEKVEQERNVSDVTMKKRVAVGDIKVKGLLPCPVRIPLLEGFDSFTEKFNEENGINITYKLEAASVGAKFLEEEIAKVESEDELPDIFVSAGFETFFDKRAIGRFKDNGVFVNPYFGEKLNDDFNGVDIEDPKGDYTIISTVPAVFMVNLQEIGDLKVPESWADLLSEEYYQKVALPVGDFDLFNAILISIYKDFGMDGVEKLGKILLKSMHPAQMVKNAGKKVADKPVVTIMPYFFTKMVRDVSTMKVVWPKDGAIISPIFMLVKRSKLEILKPVADFLFSKEVGEILSHKGLFPSLNPEVKNILPENAKFKWVGWDYIYSNDIGELIKTTNEVFEKSADEVK